jgi:hypothetical protein
MTRIDFNHLLSSLETLSPDQARQLRQRLDRRLDQPKANAAKPVRKREKGANTAPPPGTKPLSLDEIHGQMLASGLLASLPDPTLDIDDDDDPADQPVPIKGEPLSETILRERR